MRNTYYFAVTMEKCGKFSAFVVPISIHDNAASKLEDYVFANICGSKKAAQEICDLWNESYKRNGTYMYD